MKAGADVHSVDLSTHSTALICAAAKGRKKCTRILIEAGADVDAAQKDGERERER